MGGVQVLQLCGSKSGEEGIEPGLQAGRPVAANVRLSTAALGEGRSLLPGPGSPEAGVLSRAGIARTGFQEAAGLGGRPGQGAALGQMAWALQKEDLGKPRGDEWTRPRRLVRAGGQVRLGLDTAHP